MKKTRTIKLPPHVVDALKLQRARFIEKFGREPGPGDPIFFDPEKDEPTFMTNERAVTLMTRDFAGLLDVNLIREIVGRIIPE
jgi:hypothetical protein